MVANFFFHYLQKRLAAAEPRQSSLKTQRPLVRSLLTAHPPPARPRDRVPRGPRSDAMRLRARDAVAELHRQLLDGSALQQLGACCCLCERSERPVARAVAR